MKIFTTIFRGVVIGITWALLILCMVKYLRSEGESDYSTCYQPQTLGVSWTVKSASN